MYDPERARENAEKAAERHMNPPDIAERGRRVRLEAKALANAMGGTFGEVELMLREQMRERPYTLLGAALGLGYVLGGGLSGRTAMILGGVAGRMALAGLVRNAMNARDHVVEQ